MAEVTCFDAGSSVLMPVARLHSTWLGRYANPEERKGLLSNSRVFAYAGRNRSRRASGILPVLTTGGLPSCPAGRPGTSQGACYYDVGLENRICVGQGTVPNRRLRRPSR